jgi:hypothetical protein
MATIEYIGDNGPDGSVVFKSATASLGAFYGATPIVQPTAAAQSAVPTTALTTITDIVTTASVTGAVNSVIARVSALVTLVNQMRSDLVSLGLVKGS